MSRGSGFSTASAVEFRKSANCRGSPIARNYHSKINRSKEAKRIDEENLVSSIYKVGCVFAMVVVSMLPHSDFGRNYHRKDASHCSGSACWVTSI